MIGGDLDRPGEPHGGLESGGEAEGKRCSRRRCWIGGGGPVASCLLYDFFPEHQL